MSKSSINYVKKRAELDELLAWFEQDDLAIDQAIEKYQQAEAIITELEQYLTDTQAKIEQLTKKIDTSQEQ